AQDGSHEGVYGQFLNVIGTAVGGEFRVNSTVASKQFQPAVASDGANRFLAIWSSFVGGTRSFDLYAQRYTPTSVPLQIPPKPYVSAVNSSRLSVYWPALEGYKI